MDLSERHTRCTFIINGVDRMRPGQPLVWLHVIAAVVLCLAIGAVWHWVARSDLEPKDLVSQLAPLRDAWYALPVVVFAFVALGLVLVPVMLLVAATGVVFGPFLGPVYALAGCLASASTGFAIGRWMGRRRVEQLGGDRIKRLTSALKRNGTLAVFLVRKVPAPFTLVNIVVGASTVSYRDFVIGTVLGMGALVIALAGFGYQITRAVEDPSPRMLGGAALLVGVPLTLAWIINRALRRARPVG